MCAQAPTSVLDITLCNLRTSKCLSHSKNCYTYQGYLLPSRQQIFLKSFKFSNDLSNSIKHTLENIKALGHDFLLPYIGFGAFNDRIFTAYPQYISTIQNDIENRTKVNAFYTEVELKKILVLFLDIIKLLSNKDLNLSLRDISLDQIKIFHDFSLKVDLRLDEAQQNDSSYKSKQSAPNTSGQNLTQYVIPLRLLAAKVVFLESKKKFNSMNYAKLKAHFVGKKIELGKRYSHSFVDQVEDLLFNENANPLNFKFTEPIDANTSGSLNPWGITPSSTQHHWYFASETRDAQLSELLKVYGGSEALLRYPYDTAIEELDLGPTLTKKLVYLTLSRAKLINKLHELRAPSKISAFGLNRFLSRSDFSMLKILDLSACRIGDTVIKNMALHSAMWNLESLSVQSTGLTHKSMRFISQSIVLKNLKTFSAIEDGLGGDLGIRYIAESRYLQKLESLSIFDNTMVTDHGVKYLRNAKFRELKEINLEGCDVGDGTFAVLSTSQIFANLKLLNLSRTNVTHHGLEEYANSEYLKKIEILYLNDCQIGDQGIEHLKNSENTKSIQYLYLVNCGLKTSIMPILKNHENFKNLKGHRFGSSAVDPKGKNYLAM